MALLLLAIFLAITVALFLTPGVVLFGIIPLIGAVAVAVWLAIGLFGHVSPSEAMHRTRRPELLGPGGPDDPDRNR